jgi:hypothetical protein
MFCGYHRYTIVSKLNITTNVRTISMYVDTIQYSTTDYTVNTNLSYDAGYSKLHIGLRENVSNMRLLGEMNDLLFYNRALSHAEILQANAAYCSVYNLAAYTDTVAVSGTLLQISQNNDLQYSWMDCSGDVSITGAVTNVFQPTVSGNYAAEVNYDGCTATSFCTTVMLPWTPVNGLLDYFSFNYTLTGINGTALSPGGNYYVTGRNATEIAHYVQSEYESFYDVKINGMPQGNANRSVSFWFLSQYDTIHSFFNQSITNNTFAIAHDNGNIVLSNYSNQLSFPFTHDSAWHHLAVVHNNGVATLYLDGLSQTSGNITFNNNNDSIRIGMSPGGTFYTDFMMDDLYLYDRALTGQELMGLYTNSIQSHIEETGVVSNIQLFPNPTTGLFTIGNLQGNEQVVVLDMTGKMVYQRLVSDNQITIDLSHLPAAMYLVQTIDNKRVKRVNKLIIKD